MGQAEREGMNKLPETLVSLVCFGSKRVSPASLPAAVSDDPRTIPVEEIPTAIGELEAFKAALWGRLVSPAAPVAGSASLDLLTVPQVAQRLKVTRARVYELIRAGDLPCTPVGRYKRIDPAALHAWVSKRQGKDK
jgi:excisionase family DNA binding protein